MIDSHCHLDHSPLYENLNDILSRSKDIGIEKLLTISTSFKSFHKILEIIKLDRIIYGTFGIHPHESKHFQSIDSNYISEIVKKNETGFMALQYGICPRIPTQAIKKTFTIIQWITHSSDHGFGPISPPWPSEKEVLIYRGERGGSGSAPMVFRSAPYCGMWQRRPDLAQGKSPYTAPPLRCR